MFVSFWLKYRPEKYKGKHHITKNIIKMKKLIFIYLLHNLDRLIVNFIKINTWITCG